MEHEGPIGEDDLQAYIDERLAPARGAAVEEFLSRNPAQHALVDKQRSDREALRFRLAEKFAEPIPARLRIDHIRAERSARLWKRARSVVAGLAMIGIGLAGGWVIRGEVGQAQNPPGPIFLADAIDAHRTYAVEVAHPVEVAASDEAHLVTWLSNRSGRKFETPPDLRPFGYNLVGGRVLPAGSKAAAQLMYQDASGGRLTVYLRAGDEGQPAFTFDEQDGVSTFTWTDRGFQFAIAAELDRDRLLPIAKLVYDWMS